MSSKITTERYDLVRIEKLKHFLESAHQNGKPKFYEVFVDNLKVVDKTADPAVFDDYLVYMGDDTRMVKVLIYTSTENCPRNDKFLFTVHDPQQEKKKQELNGIEVENRINTAIEQERGRTQLQQLQAELADTKEQLDECEKYKDKLEEQLATTTTEFENYRKKRVLMSEMNAGKLAGYFTDYFIQNYPVVTKKLPFISTLSGLLTGEEGEQPMPELEGHPGEQSHGNASFSKMGNPTQQQSTDPATANKLLFLNQMEAAFTENQMEKVVTIIQALAARPEQVDTVYELLNTSNP